MERSPWMIARNSASRWTARHLVVEEELADERVGVVGGLVLRHDDVEDFFADGAVQPGTDDEVLPVPLGGAAGLRGLGNNVVGELVLAEEDGDEHVPLRIVGLGEVEDDGHVRFHASHVHGEGGRRRWSRGRDKGAGRGGAGERRGHRCGGECGRGHGGERAEIGSGEVG